MEPLPKNPFHYKDLLKRTKQEQWLYWVIERETIRIKRQQRLPPPWTDDPILQEFRFCNVRRMDDKVSNWLLTNWYRPYKNSPYMLLACALARFINKPETLECITHLVFDEVGHKPNLGAIVRQLRDYRDHGNTVFNGAYVVRGNNGIDKIDCVVNYYVAPLLQKLDQVVTYSMEDTWQMLYDCFGFGSFMAGQVTADMRHAVTGKWKDKYSWAPMGPGSRRGMNRLLDNPLNKPMKQQQFESHLRELIAFAIEPLKEANICLNRFEAIDYQNTLCEYDKYQRALYGTGKPKQKYHLPYHLSQKG